MASIGLHNVVKRFGDVVAVKGVSLEVPDKELLVFVGPSGCGKTTVLRMIAGIESPTSGEIVIGDRVVNRVSPSDRNIAMVFQNFALYPHMTVFQNMAFGLESRRTPRNEIRRKVEETAQLLGIDTLLRRRPSELSGGQKQRVALGRAIVRDPTVLLMDEPLSNLDAKLRVSMRSEIKKLSREVETTTVYVTHDQVEAMTLGDRIVVMHDGLIQQVDTPEQVYQYPANTFVAGTIGSPPMNLLKVEGRYESDKAVLVGKDIEIALRPEQLGLLALNGRVVLAGIRPEAVRVRPPSDENGGNVMRAIVETTEPQGPDTYLDLRLGDNLLKARVDAAERYREGDAVVVDLPAEWVRFFDANTGIRLKASDAS